MKTLVFFLEEPSAKEMLEGIRMRIPATDTEWRYVVFSGKQDLEKNLVKRLKGWLKPNSLFVIMRDQDAGDCVIIKKRLASLCMEGGKGQALVRVACHELESFYLGDLKAVEKGLGLKGIASEQQRSRFRNPDFLSNPSEELSKLTRGMYQKIAGSRAISPFLDLSSNTSHSFNVLIGGLKKLLDV